MRATTKVGALADALGFIVGAVDKRVVVPITSDCLITIEGGKATLAATDLDLLMAADVEAPEFEAGAATAPCARLAKLLDELPRGENVTLSLKGNWLTIASGKGRWRLPSLNAADFPKLDTAGDGVSFSIAKPEMLRVIGRCEHAIGEDKARFYLTGINMARREEKLVLAATNGHVLSETVVDLDPGPGMPNIIVPRKCVDVLAEIARTSDVTVRITSQRVEAWGANFSFRSKVIDGTFPRYEHVIPQTSTNSVTVASEGLTSAIKRLIAVTETKDVKSVELIWGDDGLDVCLCREPETAAEHIDPISIGGEGCVAVNGSYLVDTLDALAGEVVVIDHRGGGGFLRLMRPDELATISVIAPITWTAAAAAA